MQIKRLSGKPYGMYLTRAEKKALDAEIRRQIAAHMERHCTELEAIMLWELREEFGFGEKRLERFYSRFSSRIRELKQRYEMDSDDDDDVDVWLCTRKLKEAGIDVAALREKYGKAVDIQMEVYDSEQGGS